MRWGGYTVIGGTSYEVTGGRTLVNGTAYDIPFKQYPTYTLLGSGVPTSSAITLNYTIPANTVAITGEARWVANNGYTRAYTGLIAYRNGVWANDGLTANYHSHVGFSVSGSTLTAYIPAVNNGSRYEIYAVQSTKATWHTGSVYVASPTSSYSTVIVPPEGFICVLMAAAADSDLVNKYQFSGQYISSGVRSISGNSVYFQFTDNSGRAMAMNGSRFAFMEDGVRMYGDGSGAFTLRYAALYGV